MPINPNRIPYASQEDDDQLSAMGLGLPQGAPPATEAPGVPPIMPPKSRQAPSTIAGADPLMPPTPKITDDPNSLRQHFEVRQEQEEMKQKPGVLGKIGHILSKAGNIAGDVLVPNVMARIPGTELHGQLEDLRNQRQANKDTELQNETTRANADQLQAETAAGKVGKVDLEEQAFNDALTQDSPVTGKKNSPLEAYRLAKQAGQKPAAEAENPFAVWRKQNPDSPVQDWLKLQGDNKPDTGAQEDQRYEQVMMKPPAQRSPDDEAWRKAYERRKTLVPTANFNMQNSGVSYSPSSPEVQAVANGKVKIQDILTPRTPLAKRHEFLSAVLQANPEFKSYDYDVEKGVERAFTSGQYSQQLTSINRAREHMGTFLELAKALDNGDVKALNKVSNAFKSQFGSDAPGNLAIAKQAFASEVGKAFAGSSVALADRQELSHAIDSASSWTQFAGAAQTADALLEGAQHALKKTYDAGREGRPNFGDEKPGGPPAAAGGFAAWKANRDKKKP